MYPAESKKKLFSSKIGSEGKFVGWVCILITLSIWAAFSISLRWISHSALSSWDVAFIRYSVPAIILLPFVHARIIRLFSVKPLHMLMIACGGGIPYFMLTAIGGGYTSAAHVSALVAGTVPLSVAILRYTFWNEEIVLGKRIGLTAIIAGVLLLVLSLGRLTPEMVYGSLFLLTASLLWGWFTIGIRLSGLDPISCLILMTYPTFLILSALIYTGAVPSNLGHVELSDIGLFAVIQGGATGIISPLCYSAAIKRLGALKCASIGALAPVLTTLLAVPLLNEPLTIMGSLGVSIIVTGVMLSNRY